MNTIEVCFTPATYNRFHNKNNIVVVTDILRATSAIVAAFINGVKKVIPVASIAKAKEYKEKGYLVAAERDGIKLEFADFGNSPFNFNHANINNKDIVYSTTNGTHAINLANESYKVLIGAYLNINALSYYIENEHRNILILCAGWKDRFSLEDTLFAGALTELLLETGKFETSCDSANAALDLWLLAKPNLNAYILKAAQRGRLHKNGLDDCIEYCHTLNVTNIIPILTDFYLTPTFCCEKTNKF